MKKQLLIAALIIIAACKSKTKDEAPVNKDKIDTVATAQKDTSSTATVNPGKDNETNMGSLGDIKLGLSATGTIKTLGHPDSKTKPIEWALME